MANRRRRSDQAPQRDQAEDRVAAAPQNDQQEAQTRAVSRDEIERRAYDLYQQRGGGDGNDLEDWLRAERDLSGQ